MHISSWTLNFLICNFTCIHERADTSYSYRTVGNIGGEKLWRMDASTLLASKTLANQLITSRMTNSTNFRKSIHKFLRIKWVDAPRITITNACTDMQLWVRNLPVNASCGIAMIRFSLVLLTSLYACNYLAFTASTTKYLRVLNRVGNARLDQKSLVRR